MGFLSGIFGGGGIGSIIGAVAGGLFGQSQANSANDFNLQMANTRHQREVKDLNAAGLNPVLSANPAAGGSTPNAVVPSTPDFGGAINSALNLKQTAAQIKLLEAQARKANIDGTLASKNAPLADAQNQLLSRVLPGVTNSANKVLDGADGFMNSVTDSVSNSAAAFKKLYQNMTSGSSSDNSDDSDTSTPDAGSSLTSPTDVNGSSLY